MKRQYQVLTSIICDSLSVMKYNFRRNWFPSFLLKLNDLWWIKRLLLSTKWWIMPTLLRKMFNNWDLLCFCCGARILIKIWIFDRSSSNLCAWFPHLGYNNFVFIIIPYTLLRSCSQNFILLQTNNRTNLEFQAL